MDISIRNHYFPCILMLDRYILHNLLSAEINREIDKLKAQAKELAKKGDQVANVRTLAKHVVRNLALVFT